MDSHIWQCFYQRRYYCYTCFPFEEIKVQRGQVASPRPQSQQKVVRPRSSWSASPLSHASIITVMAQTCPAWVSFTWDHLQWGEGGLVSPHISSRGLLNHLNKAPGTDTNIFHSLLREAETGQASRRFIRGTSGHIWTSINQELKRVSMGRAQRATLAGAPAEFERREGGLGT